MNGKPTRLQGITVVAAVVFAALFGGSWPSGAQEKPAPTIADLLKKVVRFDAPARSLEEITKSLTEQTGLQIEAEACLRARTVLIRSETASAYDILVSLADLHDWTLEETGDHKVLLKRKPVRPAVSEFELAASIRSCIPKDWRNYLGIGVSPASLPPQTDDASQAAVKALSRAPAGFIASTAIRLRVAQIRRDTHLRLVDELPPDIRTGARQPWAKLAPPLQSSLLHAIVVNSFDRAFASTGGEALLSGSLFGFMSDRAKVEIALKGDARGDKGITIGSVERTDGVNRTFVGFGGSVKD